MSNEIEYRYVKGQGWIAGYKQDPRQSSKPANFGYPMPRIFMPEPPLNPRFAERLAELDYYLRYGR